MQGGLSYFTSDVHLGLQAGDPADREKRFLDFLRGIDPAGTENLFLLGDIWDFWYEYKYVVPKGYVKVLAALQELVEAGVNVYFFEGNHDVWTYRYFEELGMKKLTQPYVTEIGGKRFCLGHGDGLGPVPFGYRVLSGIFHSKVLQFLFSMLHPRIAFGFGNGWSKHNRLARHEKYVFRGEAEPLYIFADKFATENHIDFCIFGHYHVSVNLTLPCGARLIVNDSWLESSPHIIFDPGKGIANY